MKQILLLLAVALCLTGCAGKGPSTAELAVTRLPAAEINSASHMTLCLRQPGGGFSASDLYLHIPTFWDYVHREWTASIVTPVSKKTLSATGKNSKELENNLFNVLSPILSDPEMSLEVLSLFYTLDEATCSK